MLSTHTLIRKAHKHRKAVRAELGGVSTPFDGRKMAEVAAKRVRKADNLEIVDVVAWDAFEKELTILNMRWLETRGEFAVEASKSAYAMLVDREYAPSLSRAVMVGASALAMECMADHVVNASYEVVRQLFRIRHEDFPGLTDETSFEEAASMLERFVAERASGDRVDPVRPWLFGKGAGKTPKERRASAA